MKNTVRNICKKACASKNVDKQMQGNALLKLYKIPHSKYDGPLYDDLSIEQYKEVLIKEDIEYIEAELEKPNGNKVHIVIPSLIFINMSKRDIDKLFKL